MVERVQDPANLAMFRLLLTLSLHHRDVVCLLRLPNIIIQQPTLTTASRRLHKHRDYVESPLQQILTKDLLETRVREALRNQLHLLETVVIYEISDPAHSFNF